MKTLFIRFLFFIITTFSFTILKAQHITTISGKVIDSNHESLMGNVTLLSVPDSSIIESRSFTNGLFKLSSINRKEVFIKLSSLLFPDTLIHIKYNGLPEIDLGDIVLKEHKVQLNDVNISGKRSPVRYSSNGNIEVNVAGTALESSSSVMEMLTRSPNVIISDGQISVVGKGEAIIYLNGKQITTERMSTIPASQIARIDVIPNPSSKYDAEGKAVINIVTKINNEQGVTGVVNQLVTVSEFAGINANTMLDLNYIKGKFAIAGNYGLLVGKSRERLITTRTRAVPDDYLMSDLVTDWKRKFRNYSNYGLGMQYNLDQRSNISLAYSGNLEDQGGTQDSRNIITTDKTKNTYVSGIAKDEVRINNSLILNYNRNLDSLGSTLFAGAQYSRFNSAIDDFIDEKSIINGQESFRQLKNDVHHNTPIFSFQIDYSKIFNSRDKLDVGAKYSSASASSTTAFLVSEDQSDFVPDLNLSSTFKYLEKIPAAYISYSRKLSEKTSFVSGIRGEWTSYKLNTHLNNGQVIKDQYFNLFPNFLFNTDISDELKLRASYVSKITRPRYQSLNPFVIYQDRFTTIEGNPNLIPEKTHSFELGANYKKLDLRIGYNYTQDPITGGALRGADANSYVLKAINVDRDHTYFMSLSSSLNINWWSSVNTATVSYRKMIDNELGFKIVASKPQLYLYSSNTFNIDNLFKLQVLAWYLGDRYYGLYHDRKRSSITLGIEKDFISKSLKLSFTANDILNDTSNSGFYGVGQTDIFYDRTYNNSYFRLNASYNFGRLLKSNYKNRSTGEAESNRAR